MKYHLLEQVEAVEWKNLGIVKYTWEHFKYDKVEMAS